MSSNGVVPTGSDGPWIQLHPTSDSRPVGNLIMVSAPLWNAVWGALIGVARSGLDTLEDETGTWFCGFCDGDAPPRAALAGEYEGEERLLRHNEGCVLREIQRLVLEYYECNDDPA